MHHKSDESVGFIAEVLQACIRVVVIDKGALAAAVSGCPWKIGEYGPWSYHAESEEGPHPPFGRIGV